MIKPSILLINRVYPPQRGATGRLLQELAQALCQNGFHVEILTAGSRDENLRDGGIFIRRVKTNADKTFFNYAMIWAKLFLAAWKMEKPGLVITMTDPPFLVVAGKLLAKKWNIPHINWCQDLYPDILPALGYHLPEKIHNFLKRISRRSLKSCDRVVVIGRCMAKYLTQTGMDTRRMVIIPNWPNEEFRQDAVRPEFHPVKPAKPLLTDTARKFRVLYAGNLGLAHPQETILDAAAILQISNPEIEFIFVGDGPGHDRLVQERARRGLENVRLLPHQPAFQLREMMQGGDLHLISMKHEAACMAVPCKIYSSIASERPGIFIGPEESEAAKIFIEFGAGSVMAQGKPKELADEIIAYRMDGEKWFAAHKGAVAANEDFTAKNSIQRWIETIKSVIG